MHFTYMEKIEQGILANERSIQDKITEEIRKTRVRLCQKNPEDWITQLELLRDNLRKLGVIIDDVKMMTHILSNLTEEYENIVETLEEELDNDIDMLTIERILDKISSKYNIMNAWSNKTKGEQSEKALYVRQSKWVYYNCVKYGHMNRDCM